MDRAQRRADQKAKIDDMPLVKRIAIVVAGMASAFASVVLFGYLLQGEVHLGLAAWLAAAMGLIGGYQYLWAPSHRF